MPEEALDASFLEDTKDVKETKPAAASDEDSDRFVVVGCYSPCNLLSSSVTFERKCAERFCSSNFLIRSE